MGHTEYFGSRFSIFLLVYDVRVQLFCRTSAQYDLRLLLSDTTSASPVNCHSVCNFRLTTGQKTKIHVSKYGLTMQRFRKAAVTRATIIASAGFKNPVVGFKHTAKIAGFSTYTRDSARFVQEKLRDDGFTYVKNNEEIERDEIMDKNFEKYLNAFATSEDRRKLTLLLGMVKSNLLQL